MTPDEVIVEAGRLAAVGEPHVLATVVRVRRPASTRRGDRAIIKRDGSLLGWVGGACAEPAVIRESLQALADGESRLLRIGAGDGESEGDGEIVVAAGCASEGTVEVLIEPAVARPLIAVLGESPAARTLADLVRVVGWRVTDRLDGDPAAVVIAAMGRDDDEMLKAALASGVGYVGLVASGRRAAVVMAELRERGVEEQALARVRSPAGLDLGPLRQEEIAVAILAELVAWRHMQPVPGAPVAEEAIDPVCGMTVSTRGTEKTVADGVIYHFCSAGCRRRFAEDPARYPRVSR